MLVVDLGWNGTCGIALKYLLEEKKKLDITVCSALVGAKDGQEPTVRMANGDLFVYGFARNMNYDLQKNHMGKDVDYHNLLMEILFTAPEPSFLKFYYDKSQSELLFNENRDKNNCEIIKGIHAGIQTFSKMYFEFSILLSSISLNILGKDALLDIQNQWLYVQNCLSVLGDFCLDELSGISDQRKYSTFKNIISNSK